VLVLAAALAAAGPGARGRPAGPPGSPTAEEAAGMREYRRHAPKYGCLCCSVYIPAPKAAVVPRDIGATPLLSSRLYENKPRLSCWTWAGEDLWLADDAAVYRIDGRRRRLARTVTSRDGLADVAIRQLVADGESLWIVGAGAVSRLALETGEVGRVACPAFGVARMAAGPAGTFLLTDRGAYRWNASTGAMEPLAAYPGQERVAKAAARGFWEYAWRDHWPAMLRDAAVARNALYVIAGNTLSRFDGQKWRELSRAAWQLRVSGDDVFALTTAGMLHCDDRTGVSRHFAGGAGPAPGRPAVLIAARQAAYLLVEGTFAKQGEPLQGGGICRFDPRSATWDDLAALGGTPLGLPTAATSAGELFAAVQLAIAVHRRSLHPGMARVKRNVPRVEGLAVAVGSPGGEWRLVKLSGLPGEVRWVLGQRDRRQRDRLRPQRIVDLLSCGGRLWATTENYPEHFYGGYVHAVQCVARRGEDGWRAVADRDRLASLHLAGEQPALLCLTATHGEPVVLGHGQRRVLGLVECAGTAWVVHEGGAYAYDAETDRFSAVLVEPFRAYWQVTAADGDASAVYFGSDAGTITRYDRRSGRFELLGVCGGRKVERVAVRGGKVYVRTADSQAALPHALKDLPKIGPPAADVLVYDGAAWTPAAAARMPPAKPPPWQFDKAGYLGESRGGRPAGRRIGYVRGVFQPRVLCADDTGTAWIAVWGGVGRVSLPAEGAGGEHREEGGR
jgi:hypothetical protein